MISAFFIGVGIIFITLGTIALVRFDDIYAKLHAISKVDNLGLGFIVLGLLVQANSRARIKNPFDLDFGAYLKLLIIIYYSPYKTWQIG